MGDTFLMEVNIIADRDQVPVSPRSYLEIQK